MNLWGTIRADWAVEPQKSDRLTVTIFRLGQWSHGRKSRTLAHAAYRVLDTLWTRTIVGAEIPPSIECGPGFRLRHWGRGVIIHPRAVIGSRVSLYHRVTIGEDNGQVPVLGSRIQVGTGATILGGIKVADNRTEKPTFVGAGAVVTKDVEHGTSVGGVPAKVIGHN